MSEPLLTVHYSDDSVVLRTRTNAEVSMPAADALALAAALVRSVDDLMAHREMVEVIDSIAGDDGPPDTLGA